MKRKYWVLSPNVMNGSDEIGWKDSIQNLKRAFIGYDDTHRFGQMFKNEIRIGDVVLISQGQNSNKNSSCVDLWIQKQIMNMWKEHLTPHKTEN